MEDLLINVCGGGGYTTLVMHALFWRADELANIGPMVDFVGAPQLPPERTYL